MEHPAQRRAIHDAGMHAKAHDRTGALVHHDLYPVRAKYDRFATKQVETPQAVLCVTEDGEAGRPGRVWCRPVPNGEDASHHIHVDRNTEGQGNLLRDPRTTPGRIPTFHLEDGRDDFLGGSSWAGFVGTFEEKSRRYYAVSAPSDSGNRRKEMEKKDRQVAHRTILARSNNPQKSA
jgi:hypothetical protein